MERESSEAPPGETWLMHYVMNVDADARWLWAWSDGSRHVRCRTLPGTLVVVQRTEPAGPPVRFADGPRGPERVSVALPADPVAVCRGDW